MMESTSTSILNIRLQADAMAANLQVDVGREDAYGGKLTTIWVKKNTNVDEQVKFARTMLTGLHFNDVLIDPAIENDITEDMLMCIMPRLI